MGRVFINYRRQDSEGYVGRLYDRLIGRFDHEDIFMDIDSIQPGVDFVQAVEDAVAACDIFLAVIGPRWLTISDEAGQRRLDQWNDFVRMEIASALKQDKTVIPVLVGNGKMPLPNDLPEDIRTLSRRNAIELSHQRFPYDVDKLIQVIGEAMPLRGVVKSSTDSETLRQKAAALKVVRDEVVNATASPLYAFRSENRLFPVPGEGNPDANILFIGEAPGKTEAERGQPFIGPSGDVLNDMLATIKLKREDVYVTNLLLDRPPQKREPTVEEINFYAPYVDRIIDIIQPGIIATLGKFATQYMLKKLDLPEKRNTITQLHGKLIKTRMPYGEIHLVPLFHPAVVLYSAGQKETLKADFQKLKLFI